MPRPISSASSSARAVFFIGAGLGAALPLQFDITDLLAEADEFAHKSTKAPVLVNLLAGALYGGALGNDPGNGFAVDRAGEGELRAVPPIAFLGTVAGGLAATAVAFDERTRAQLADGSQLLTDLFALLLKRSK